MFKTYFRRPKIQLGITMNLKHTIIASAVFAVLASSQANAADTDLKPYIEGQIGYINLSKVNGTLNETSGAVTATNFAGRLNYHSNETYGAELGFKNVMMPNLRVGMSFATMKLNLKNATTTGTITGGGYSVTVPGTFSAAELAASGLSFDNRVHLYMANAYYDFKNESKLTPFVGVGMGVADIQNAKSNEFTYTVNAGAKYNIDQHIYIGAKAAYSNINGPADQLGFKYKNIEAYTANLSLGFEF